MINQVITADTFRIRWRPGPMTIALNGEYLEIVGGLGEKSAKDGYAILYKALLNRFRNRPVSAKTITEILSLLTALAWPVDYENWNSFIAFLAMEERRETTPGPSVRWIAADELLGGPRARDTETNIVLLDDDDAKPAPTRRRKEARVRSKRNALVRKTPGRRKISVED